MKRKLYAVLCTALIAALMTGCGTSPTASEKAAETASKHAETTDHFNYIDHNDDITGILCAALQEKNEQAVFDMVDPRLREDEEKTKKAIHNFVTFFPAVSEWMPAMSDNTDPSLTPDDPYIIHIAVNCEDGSFYAINVTYDRSYDGWGVDGFEAYKLKSIAESDLDHGFPKSVVDGKDTAAGEVVVS